MSKGYWMVSVTIRDPDTYKRYIEENAVAFARYGGRFLARGGRYEGPEGPTGTRNAIIEFDSYERALACYRSPEYQAALQLRLASSSAHMVIVEGVE
ncbi:DUF1330 domain-containing protein [Devosia sp.]|uniref:DUF1330 domain-containing protein n=1 Tax=Devosia sp. TaxID=1871048 RepID=UPI00375369DA